MEPLRSLREGKFKLIAAPRPELYDLEDDPVEEKNIYDARRAQAEKMIARLAAFGRGAKTGPPHRPRTGVDPGCRHNSPRSGI
jgi:hypothetical protein